MLEVPTTAEIALPATRWRFGVARLLLNTTIVAAFLPFLALFGRDHLAPALALALLTAFAVCELREAPEPLRRLPRYCRVSFGLSRIALAYAIAISMSLVEWTIRGPASPPVPPAQPPTSFFGALFYLVSGKFLVGIGEALATAFGQIINLVMHWGLFLLFGSISCIAALVAARRYKPARWLAALTLPALLVFVIWLGWALFQFIVEWNRDV
jgi:hypothetical protein